jgi:hypothetical protein
VVQAIEHLPCKLKALSSNPSTTKQQQQQNQSNYYLKGKENIFDKPQMNLLISGEMGFKNENFEICLGPKHIEHIMTNQPSLILLIFLTGHPHRGIECETSVRHWQALSC